MRERGNWELGFLRVLSEYDIVLSRNGKVEVLLVKTRAAWPVIIGDKKNTHETAALMNTQQ